jgi:hypothetical protein
MRSPSPSRSPPPEKDTSHTSKGTDSLKAKFELVDDLMMPTDTVIPEKSLRVKDSQPEPPSPLNGTTEKRVANPNPPPSAVEGGWEYAGQTTSENIAAQQLSLSPTVPGHNTASPSPLLQSYMHSSMGDGGGVTLSLLEEPFGCWGMVLMRVVDSRRRRLSPRSHSRRWLLLSGHVSQRNILLLWTS